MESDWRWGVAEAGMSGTDWQMAAWSLLFPEYRLVRLKDFNGSTFYLRPSPAFLPVLIWEGFQLPSTTMTEALALGLIGPD